MAASEFCACVTCGGLCVCVSTVRVLVHMHWWVCWCKVCVSVCDVCVSRCVCVCA